MMLDLPPLELATGVQAQRIYRGDHLLQIALPLGGIGAGCVCLNGYGGLQDFSIRHAPATSAAPDRHVAQDAGFALLRLPDVGQTRLVEGPFPREKIYNLGLKSQGYNGGGHEGLPRFADCTFVGEYPFGVVRLGDPGLPVEVTLTGFSPFIPLDDVNSGLPCALLEYTLQNTSPEAVPYEFSYHLSHLAQRGAESTAGSRVIPGLGVFFFNAEPGASPARGSAALGILGGDPVVKGRWFRGGWFDALSVLWREVSTGVFRPADGLASGPNPQRAGGSVQVRGTLPPSSTITYAVIIVWHFPNIAPGEWGGGDERTAWRPFYAARWPDAAAVLAHVTEHYSELRRRTVAFHDALFGSTLPAVLLDAISANLAVLKSPTVLRGAGGGIWAWEGCFCDRGCCPGSCTHVWNYAQALPHLFPALERTLREAEYDQAIDERGHINFRVAPPGLPTPHDFHAAADGQLGGILKLHREWQIGGDTAWLARLYPLAKRSIDYCRAQWDPQDAGLIEAPHHNTYDIEFWGPEPLCSGFYVAALAAMAELADAVGRPGEAEVYRAASFEAAAALETLFNGEYYEQKVAAPPLSVELFELQAEEDRFVGDEGPKYQYGQGCLSDGVWGPWLARLCGVESPQSAEHIRSHLAAVYRHNFKSSLVGHANTQRPGYALGDEGGLLLCTWPAGGRPPLPFVYSDEIWTGIEHQVAAHLIAEGLVAEGLTVETTLRARYDGRARNPWNEYECGNYYARAMASYALLIAYSGFRYSAVTHTLQLSPATTERPFRCFFSTASGWGTLVLTDDGLKVELCEGSLPVDTLDIRLFPDR